MKRSFSIFAGFALIAFLFISCDRSAERIAEFSFTPNTQAFIKVNYASAYAANPGVQIELNKTRVSSLITARTPFPGGGYNTGGGNYPDYLNIAPGNTELSIVIPKKGTNVDSVTLFDKSISFEAGKNYTVHIADTGANTKYVVINDDITMPETGKAKYMFVNLMPNVPAIDLYYGTTVVASNIPFMGNSGYINLPLALYGSQAWSIRETGAAPTSTALATYTSASTILNQRVYTAFAMGYKGSADAARKPYISFLLNR